MAAGRSGPAGSGRPRPIRAPDAPRSTPLALPEDVRHGLAEPLGVDLALDQALDLRTPAVAHLRPVGVVVREAAPGWLAVERGLVEAVLLQDLVVEQGLEDRTAAALVHEQLGLLRLAKEGRDLPGLVLLLRGRVHHRALDVGVDEALLGPLRNRSG